MACECPQFPPQHQETQPGKEYLMNPLPQFSSPEYKPSNKLLGKVALVTGGDSGIGRSVSYLFTLEGATVAFTYVKGHEERDAQDTLRILEECRVAESMPPIAVGTTDLGLDRKCKRVVEKVVAAFGRIDILVNGAGEVRTAQSVEEIDEKRLEKIFRTNVFSQFFMVRHALKHMKDGSTIINTASVSAYKGYPQVVDYAATKGAVVAFTRSLAIQLVSRGIRVNGVAPGPIWTPIIPSSLDSEDVVNFGCDVPMKRAGQPIEVAPSYVFLACNYCSSYFSGQFLHPNGGETVNA